MPASRTDGAAALLDCLGLSAVEEYLYLRLLTEPRLSTAEIGRRLDMAHDRVHAQLHSLAALGLVVAARHDDAGAWDESSEHTGRGDAPDAWYATAPDIALEALVRAREADLTRLRGRVEELMRNYRQGHQAVGPDELIEVVSGQEAIAACWRALQHSARTSLRVLDKAPHILVASPADEAAVIRRGVAVQVIYEHAAVRDPERLATIREFMDIGEDCRMLATLPFKLALVDDRWALLPVSTGTALQTALVVRPCSLLDALSGLFALSWSQAMRVPRAEAEGEPGAAGRRRELLTLLASGLTDESIARQLGISTRTVQRLIRDFMDSFGAQTRFQAGVQAARAELL
ncbi:helix-turn-helix transcriptional regulator [Streptacidiphilus fuscans]|uniref:Helix-turn-helix domain-containing protein n=1 Tax=Streptacidiphilus fuscans TaxID=2789292 RepID=A0A931B4T9_9ACTN|nr:helix-turn-helix domain-containing protein [Streptacidiphilus fuscans]MBF9069001.1 helix-turn-helix domain-containing protein [Streptacidiphilus fuscans]